MNVLIYTMGEEAEVIPNVQEVTMPLVECALRPPGGCPPLDSYAKQMASPSSVLSP